MSWVPEDASPKGETRQMGQSDPPHDRPQERKLNITQRMLEEGLTGTTQSRVAMLVPQFLPQADPVCQPEEEGRTWGTEQPWIFTVSPGQGEATSVIH